jgi:XTP/dITP diphosphohydrolase
MPPSSAPAPRKRLVIASANAGKLAEFRALLAALPFDLTSLGEMALPSPEETGSTFLANATLKARQAAEATGLAAIADDSGLEVDALGGAPGVYSARYAGMQGDDAANNLKLVQALEGRPRQERRARYRCVLVLVRDPFDPDPLIA